MRRGLVVLAASTLIASLLLPKVISAKAPTVKITVSGPGLNRTVEITDSQVLALSDVWAGQFLDISKNPENEPPKGTAPFKVSFFVKLAGQNIRRMYVAYYYPETQKQGFLYLPGRGDDYWLNVSTIVRRERDGKWNYASPAWETLIKLALARAQAE